MIMWSIYELMKFRSRFLGLLALLKISEATLYNSLNPHWETDRGAKTLS